MRSNIKLGKVSRIEIGLHYSWFVIAALIGFSLGEHFRHVNPNWSASEVWITSVFTALLFFITLLLHELAHSLVAQARGLKVKAITLFALGGVSQIEDEASDAKTEFWVAIAGPVASVVIGFDCLALAGGLGWRPSTEPHTAITAVLVWLGYINFGLGLFNMIPGFPLDGGRVFRAIVWAITKNADRSIRIAVRVGQVVAFLFILDGVWSFFNGAGLNGLWVAFIGWFLMDAAQSSYAQVDVAAALRGMRVSEVMSRDCPIVSHEMSIQELVDTCVFRTGQRCFPVEDRGDVVGLITLKDVGAVPRDRWDSTTVREAMRPVEQLHLIAPDTPVLEALQIMAGNDINQLPVVANGVLQGVVSRSHLVQLLQTRSELQRPSTHYPPLHRLHQRGVTP